MNKVLNLAKPEISSIKFQVSNFPDGQQDIVINPKDVEGYFSTDGETEYFVDIKIKEVEIKSRLNSFRDLELIICATKALKRLKVKEIDLYIPYLIGARSDRQFQVGGNSYLVDVLSPVINGLEFENVTVLDVHSDVAPACIKNLASDSMLDQLLIEALYRVNSNNSLKCYVIAPDSGASKRTFETCKKVSGFDFEIVECSKHRDLKTGKIVETIIPKNDFENMDCIILDDIIDGGRTFIELSKQLKEKNCGDIYLCATHGIFSAGLEVFKPYIKQIFTTNSYQEEKNDGDFVKYLNVF
jgi:ribose-phosphate pyrophosphokinase